VVLFTRAILFSLFAASLCSTSQAQLFRCHRSKPVCIPCGQPVVSSFSIAPIRCPGSGQNANMTLKSYRGPADYGKWCGANNTSYPSVAPVDGVDAVCKNHDLCINRNGHHCKCDAEFLRDMPHASASNEHAEAYRIASMVAIASKPCFCTFNYPCCDGWPPRCGTCEGRYPGVGGQCGPR
jgi:hypothetical protein